MRRMLMWCVAVMFVAAGVAQAMPITIDGDLLDWEYVIPASQGNNEETTDDMPTGADFDISEFFITSDTNNVYVRIDIDANGSFTGGYTDYENPAIYELWFGTDAQDTVGLGWGGFWTFAPDYRIDLAAALDPGSAASEVTVYKYASDYAGTEELYDSVGVAQIAINLDDNAFELSVPREVLGIWTRDNTNGYGNWLMPMAYFVGDEIWDNEEYFPNGAAQGGTGIYHAVRYNCSTEMTSSIIVGNAAMRDDAITIDGDMLDWDGIDAADHGVTAEETGDSPSGAEVDLADLKMGGDADNLYVYFSINSEQSFADAYLNYDNGAIFDVYFDMSLGDTTGLTWGWWPLSMNYYVDMGAALNPENTGTEATVYYFTGNSDGSSPWEENFVQVGTAPFAMNLDGNAVEFAIAWEDLGGASDYFHIALASLANFVWGSDDFIPNGWNTTVGPMYAITYGKYNGGAMNTYELLDPATSVGDEPNAAVMPESYEISTVHPNPFNASTSIQFNVPQAGLVDVSIYNIAGQRISTLTHATHEAGSHRLTWSGVAQNGMPVSSGVYFIRVSGSAGNAAVARTVLMK